MENIKKLRIEKGLTQVQLAVKVGVSLMTVRLWEMGASKPNDINMQRLMDALNILPFSEE